MQEYDYEMLLKATKNFSNSQIIGKGSHGCVYKGVLEDGQAVAIKRSSVGLQNLQDNSKLENEASILSSLANTPSMVSLLGTSHHQHNSVTTTSSSYLPNSDTANLMLVMEFLPNGSLHDLLHANPRPQMLLSWSKRAQIALQIAKALQYLHSMNPNVIHRDIKSANVLFDKDWNAKLADLGLALRLNKRVNLMSRPAGTFGYLDPCYTTSCLLSTKIDVFSFGVVLLEIISGQKVIDASRNSTCIIDWALPLIKQRKFGKVYDQKIEMPIFMEATIRKLLNIAVRCVSFVGNDRPTMDEIVCAMENCYVGRDRFAAWVKFLRRIIVLKSDGKTATKKRALQQHNAEISKGKLLLKDILADGSLK